MAWAWGCSGTGRFWHEPVHVWRADGITVSDHDRRHHPLRRGRGLLRRAELGPGGTVTLHVSCRTERYDIVIHRWGADKEQVWAANGLVGTEHATPADADSNGCGWPVAVTVPIGDDWRSGFYLVTLTAHGAPADRAVGYTRASSCRAGAPRARALLVLATNTYNAYNSWGGRSLYTGGQRGLVRPAVRARHAGAAADRARRSQVAPDVPRRGARRRRR